MRSNPKDLSPTILHWIRLRYELQCPKFCSHDPTGLRCRDNQKIRQKHPKKINLNPSQKETPAPKSPKIMPLGGSRPMSQSPGAAMSKKCVA
jgi:hypothetical protein